MYYPVKDCRTYAIEAEKKAAQGEKVTVAVSGGSITQGTISSGSSDSLVENKRCYADIFFSWWKETFPQTEFEFINAGIGATDSYLGVHRVQTDVLDYNPDIVLVEFAVNDANSVFYKKTYDNLVRIIAKSGNEPAILLLFMAQTNGAGAQENQSNVGFSYSMPMVSYRNVIKEMMETGKYSDKELSSDEVHPSALGHAIAGEIIWKYLNSIYADLEEYGEPEPLEKPAETKECYANARILDSEQIKPESSSGFEEKEVFFSFPNDWTCEEGGGEIKFTASFANLGVLYYRQIDGNGGQYEIYVDGNMEAVLNADFKGGWGNCAEAQECFTSDEVKEHEIVIKEKEDSTGSSFTILGLMLSDGAGN
ncbi:MAG: SGNH/GDSL hydrolase family protein, partial [Lachnospiraceae bacterium]|nr:SGNH/GDSL hydrolase family protein [Lachnospiraceae bacterium]